MDVKVPISFFIYTNESIDLFCHSQYYPAQNICNRIVSNQRYITIRFYYWQFSRELIQRSHPHFHTGGYSTTQKFMIGINKIISDTTAHTNYEVMLPRKKINCCRR